MKSIKIVFDPSFMFASEVVISDGNTPTLNIKVITRNEHDSIETLHDRTFPITKEELSTLEKSIDRFNEKYAGPQDGFGLDGILVVVTSDRLEPNDTVKFWSPRREGTDTLYYELLDPVFNILRKYLTSDAEIMYVEQLEQYFDYGVPIIKTGDDQYRIYGSLSYFEHVTKAIDALVDEIPANKTVLIDMSNFQGMGTIYYPWFKKLLTKNNQIKWIVNERAREQLIEIGWSESNLEPTTRKNFGEF